MEAVGTSFAIAPLCAKIVKSVYEVKGKYKRAPRTMVAIAKECSAMHVILEELNHLKAHVWKYEDQERTRRVADSLDTLVLGCWLTLDAIEEVVEELLVGSPEMITQIAQRPRYRTRFVFKEDEMKELLEQLRGYQTSLSTLIGTMQTRSNRDIYNLILGHGTVLGELVQRSRKTLENRTASSRSSVPSSKRSSVIEAFDKVSKTAFNFDTDLIHSRVYKKALGQTAENQTVDSLLFRTVSVGSADLQGNSEEQACSDSSTPGCSQIISLTPGNQAASTFTLNHSSSSQSCSHSPTVPETVLLLRRDAATDSPEGLTEPSAVASPGKGDIPAPQVEEVASDTLGLGPAISNAVEKDKPEKQTSCVAEAGRVESPRTLVHSARTSRIEIVIRILGAKNVGKRSLVHRFVRGAGKFDIDRPRYHGSCTVDGDTIHLEIYDGYECDVLQAHGGLLTQHLERADGFMLVYSITSWDSFERVKSLRDMAMQAKRDTAKMILVGSNCHLESQRQVSSREGELLARQFGCAFFEASAREKQNVEVVFHELVRAIRCPSPSVQALPSHFSCSMM